MGSNRGDYVLEIFEGTCTERGSYAETEHARGLLDPVLVNEFSEYEFSTEGAPTVSIAVRRGQGTRSGLSYRLTVLGSGLCQYLRSDRIIVLHTRRFCDETMKRSASMS